MMSEKNEFKFIKDIFIPMMAFAYILQMKVIEIGSFFNVNSTFKTIERIRL